MPNIPPQISQDVINEANALIGQITPQLDRLIGLLKANGASDFEITLGTGDVLHWDNGAYHSPTQSELSVQILRILDEQYTPKISMFMGMMWNPNQLVAAKIAEVVATYRKRDRAQVEAQIVALLTAFKQSQ